MATRRLERGQAKVRLDGGLSTSGEHIVQNVVETEQNISISVIEFELRT